MGSEHQNIKYFIADAKSKVDSIMPTIPLVGFLQESSRMGRQFATIDGMSATHKIVSNLEESHFCLLPYPWSSYVNKDDYEQLESLIIRCLSKGIYLIIWDIGDHEAIIPFPNVVQFQNGLHRTLSRRPRYAFELPAFWPDYLSIYFNGKLRIRRKSTKPVIGFCGQGTSTLLKLSLVTARSMVGHFCYAMGTAKHIPPPLLPVTLLRNRILRLLSSSSGISTNFIVRSRYRAGVRAKTDRDNYFHPTKLEFVNNIIDTDYTLCVRGGGNFSVRLYETLSCGRIPIFVDTDSRLPYDFLLDWKQYSIWIDQSEIKYIAEKVADFHADLTDDDFVELQVKCRQIWAEWLNKEAFLERFHEHILFVRKHNTHSRVVESIEL